MDRLRRFRWPIMIGLTAAAGAVVLSVLRPAPAAPAITITLRPTPSPSPATPATIRVYVSGAVKRPDVYALPAGSIVKDAMEAAGGPAEEADLDRINLAAPLGDGLQVHFPRRGEAAPTPQPGFNLAAPAGPININTATPQQLETLPGIGPTLAQRIVDYRTANGPFKSIEDVKNVKGIGDSLFEKIKDSITVGP